MSASSAPNAAVTGIRTALGVAGALAIIVGVLILAWPGRTAMIVTAIIAVYAVVAGLFYGAIGIFSSGRGGWARVGTVILGVLFLVAGLVAFANLAQTTTWLAGFLGILVGILWIAEGVVSLTSLGDAASKVWSIVFSILAIVAGIILLFSPLWGIAALWWLLGISLIILGVINVGRAITYGRRQR